jgi:DNA-3-methyladenine glycosylase II
MWGEAEEFLSKDKYIGLLIKKHGPCKIVPRKKSGYFVELVEAIVSQQLSGKAAATIFGRLKEKVKGDITFDNILKLRKSTLRSCGLSNAKSDYVKDLAKHVKNGRLEIDRLDDLTDEKVREELVAVKGIGRWTADMFLMFALARPDVFPIDDLGIRNGIKKLVKKDMKPEKMAEFAKCWRPYRTIASWYIWASLDDK